MRVALVFCLFVGSFLTINSQDTHDQLDREVLNALSKIEWKFNGETNSLNKIVRDEVVSAFRRKFRELLDVLRETEAKGSDLSQALYEDISETLEKLEDSSAIDDIETATKKLTEMHKSLKNLLLAEIVSEGQKKFQDKIDNFEKEVTALAHHNINKRGIICNFFKGFTGTNTILDVLGRLGNQCDSLRNFFLQLVQKGLITAQSHVTNIKNIATAFLSQIPGVKDLAERLKIDEDALSFFGPYKEKLGSLWCRVIAVYNKTVATFARLHPINVLQGTVPTPEPLPAKCTGDGGSGNGVDTPVLG